MSKHIQSFNLEELYQFFLTKMGLDESKMHPTQRIQIKDTFMGTWGMCLLVMREEVAALPEDQAVVQMQSMLDQVTMFFATRVKSTK